MLPLALLLLTACPELGPRPAITGTVTVSATGELSGQLRLVAPAPVTYTMGFRAQVQRERCGEVEVVDVRYTGGRPRRAADGALFVLRREEGWLPHPGVFHDMRVWLRLPPGWVGLLSGERPRDPPRCDARGCLHGPFAGTGQPGAMLVAAPRRLRLARGDVEVFVAPEHEASLEPLLETAAAQAAAFEARFGPRATRSLAVWEAETDGGFSVHGLIALAPGAVAAFAESAREAPLLAHELCHHWFGSIASGHSWLTEGLCRHCELWWVRHAEGEAAAATFEARLAEQSAAARPGLALRDMGSNRGSWRDYEAVAYSRGALVHQRWREALGPERHDAVLRAHLAAHRGRRVELELFLALTASVAPEADVAALTARWVDRDVDPRTGEARPARLILTSRVAAALAAVVLLVSLFVLGSWPRRALAALAFAGALFALWRGPGWVPGELALAAALGWGALVLALRRRPPA